MKHVSLQEKIKAIGGLKDNDLTPWEQGFVVTVGHKAHQATQAGQVTAFSDNQIEKIEQIYDKHFNVADD